MHHLVSDEDQLLRQFVIESKPTLLLSMVIAGVTQGIGFSTSKLPYQRLYQAGISLAVLLVPSLAIGIYGPQTWFTQAGIVIWMSVVAVVLAWKQPVLQELGKFAHLFVGYWLLMGLPHLLHLSSPHNWAILGILLAASLFYGLAAQLLKQRLAVVMAIVTVVFGLLHLFAWFEFALAYKMAIVALLGAGLIVLSSVMQRFSTSMKENTQHLEIAGKSIFFVSVLATMLFGMQMLARQSLDISIFPIVNTLILEAGLAGLFYWTRKNDQARNLYFSCALVNLGLAGILIVTLLELAMWRKLELASIGLGSVMIILGFRAWLQETTDQHKQATVSPMFLLGSLLIGIPMAMVVMGYRASNQFMVMDEGFMLAAGLLLLGAGCICQLRIPAIAGAILTMLYLVGLLLFVPWGQLGTASLMLAGGGASLFLIGLGLSIFRDRLLALPQKMKEHRGIFQVLGWR